MSCTFKGVTLTWEMWKQACRTGGYTRLPNTLDYMFCATVKRLRVNDREEVRPTACIIGRRRYKREVVDVDWKEFAEIIVNSEGGVRIR